MKSKILFALLATVVLMCSCKKEDNMNVVILNGTKYDINPQITYKNDIYVFSAYVDGHSLSGMVGNDALDKTIDISKHDVSSTYYFYMDPGSSSDFCFGQTNSQYSLTHYTTVSDESGSLFTEGTLTASMKNDKFSYQLSGKMKDGRTLEIIMSVDKSDMYL